MTQVWTRLGFRHGSTLIHTDFLRSYHEAQRETADGRPFVGWRPLRLELRPKVAPPVSVCEMCRSDPLFFGRVSASGIEYAVPRIPQSGGFGGWADEKIKTVREAAPHLGRKKISSTTFDNISAPSAKKACSMDLAPEKWRRHVVWPNPEMVPARLPARTRVNPGIRGPPQNAEHV